eukprot:4605675-Prymnesium_polylepis.1
MAAAHERLHDVKGSRSAGERFAPADEVDVEAGGVLAAAACASASMLAVAVAAGVAGLSAFTAL